MRVYIKLTPDEIYSALDVAAMLPRALRSEELRVEGVPGGAPANMTVSFRPPAEEWKRAEQTTLVIETIER